ncbi:hypothetical protein GQ53DRAFT_415805 [Thozetella sp. PMI_491]|nr:hypothetical protein GQ53DRAFT_415805 [Thozetella sp. PMI_491]
MSPFLARFPRLTNEPGTFICPYPAGFRPIYLILVTAQGPFIVLALLSSTHRWNSPCCKGPAWKLQGWKHWFYATFTLLE